MAEQSELNEQWSRLTSDAAADEKLAERLREQPWSVLKEYGLPVPESSEANELGEEALAHATGGMKYTRGTTNSNVIDARGGQFEVVGVKFTLNVNGTISSINGKSTGAS
jgi:hypothetical protein